MWALMHLWVLVVPVFVIGYAMRLREASGPFWIGGNIDPEYVYLMNSLSLTQGMSVGHADHPGSTLQWAGASWLYGIHTFLGKDELVTDVLTRPEWYLAHMHGILLSVLFFSLVIAGWLALKWTGDPVVGLLMQLGFFIPLTTRNALSRMSPEPLLVILGVWLAITVLYHQYLIQHGKGKEPFWQYGLIGGMGLGLKLTFLPPWFLPLILLKGVRHRIQYLGISGIVFLTLTANPLMDFKGFLGFTFNQIVAREGHNSPIVSGSNKVQAMIDGLSLLLLNIWKTEKPLLLLFLIFVANGLLVMLVKSFKDNHSMSSWHRRLWIGLSLTLSAQIVLVANGPWAWLHYMCPVLGLTGLFAASIWQWPEFTVNTTLRVLSWRNATYVAAVALMTGLTLFKLPGEFDRAMAGARNWQEANQFKRDHQLLEETTVYYYRTSNIPYALGLGNDFARRHFSRRLASLYPNFYFFSPTDNRIYGQFDSDPLSLDDVVNLSNKVLIQGQIWNPPILPLLEKTGYYKGGPGPSLELTHSSHPPKTPPAFSAKVIFRGSVEWIILLKSPAHHSNMGEKNLN